MKILKYVVVVVLVMAVVLTINYPMSGNNALTASTVLTVKEMKGLTGGQLLNHKCKSYTRENCQDEGVGCYGVAIYTCFSEPLWNCVLDYEWHSQPDCFPPQAGNPPCSWFNYKCTSWYIGK